MKYLSIPRLLIFDLFVLFSLLSYAQITNNPSVAGQNNNCIIRSVQLTDKETIVHIQVPATKNNNWVRFDAATVCVPSTAWPISYARQSKLSLNDMPDGVPSPELYPLIQDAIKRIRDGRQQLSDDGYLIRSLGDAKLDTKYKTKSKNGNQYWDFYLHFDRLPMGCEDFYIRELADNGYEWYGIKINNPLPASEHVNTNLDDIRTRIDSNNDGICGIYETTSTDDNKYTLACIKVNGEYKVIYLNSVESLKNWRIGDVKAVLLPSATPGLFKAEWRMANKRINSNCYISFDGATMSVILDGDKTLYIKMYPNQSSQSSASSSNEWSGTGFALKDGYIVTNYHVVENAKSISIKGVKGDFTQSFAATVVASDKINDLAIIKISDTSFTGFGQIPYSISSSISDVGEDIFVLGYPLTSTMGDEIKLTTGVVSSKTGFQGDVALYQISAPIQPGNSGGPLFDKKGNIIGIVSAKHVGAENVGYAIKASYLRNLIESALNTSIIPTSNSVSSLPLTGKVKSEKNFVFYIECNSSSDKSPSSFIVPTNSVIIESPSFDYKMDSNLTLNRVILSPSETVLEFSFQNRYEQGWMSIDPNASILYGGNTYKLVSSDLIEISPKTTPFDYVGQIKSFRLHFKPVPMTADKISFSESDGSMWLITGINCKK